MCAIYDGIDPQRDQWHVVTTLPRVRVRSSFRIAAFAFLVLVGGEVNGKAQSTGPVRLSLHEAYGRPVLLSCTLEVMLRETSGEAVIGCERNTQPVSSLAVRRMLTASEATRVYALASAVAPPRSKSPGNPDPAAVDGVQVSLTLERDNERVVLDASRGLESLPTNHQELLQMLREIAEDLRGTGRR